MSELLHHRFAADLEVRSGTDGRTVMGICCPFDTPTSITEWGVTYTEQFARGSYERTIANRADKIKFLALHDRGSFPLGRAELLREDAAGLYGEFRVSKTTRGDEALELIRDGALDGFSVGFVPIRSTPDQPRNGDSVTRQEVRLSEVSAVSFPAYDTARIAGVRSESNFLSLMHQLDMLRWANPPGLDQSKLDAFMGWAELARAGKALSTSTMAELQGVLDLIASADVAVDAAIPKLALLMGVPNPDTDDESSEPDSGSMPSSDMPPGRESVSGGTLTRGVIGYTKTATTDAPWDAGANVTRLPNDATSASQLREEFAWVDPSGDPLKKSSYKFPHHMVSADGKIGAANLAACSAVIGALNGGRGGADIPAADRQGVYNAVAGHLRDAGKDVPPLRSQALDYDHAVRIARRHRIAV